MNQGGADASFARFSTDPLPEHARLEASREFFGRPLIGLGVETWGDQPFRLATKLCPLPEIAVGTVDVRGGRIERTRESIAADGKDDFALAIVTRGRSLAAQRGRQREVLPGEAVLTTDADLATVSFPSDMQFLILRPSRRALTALVPNLDDLVLRPIRGDREPLQLLAGYSAMVQGGSALATPAMRHLVAAHLLDLVALVLGASRDAAALAEGRGLGAARLNAIKADVIENLTHRDLSIGAVAARHGITPRYVGKLFEGEGISFSEFVMKQRLERGRRLLTDPRGPTQSISAVAFDAGFNDLSYFNRCFRRQYGASPGEIRDAARQS